MCKEQAFPRYSNPFPQLCLLSANKKAGQIKARYLQPGRREVTENLIRIFHPAVLIHNNLFGQSLQHLWELHQDVCGPALKVWLRLHNQSTAAATIPACRKCNRRFSLPFCKTIKHSAFCRAGGGRNKKKKLKIKNH